MDPDDDDERLMAPQEAADVEREDQVEQLAEEQREEDEAQADYEEEAASTADRAGHYEELMLLIQAIFGGDQLDLDQLEGLSAHEKMALKALAEAVRGVDLDDDKDMIYAEQRLEMLNEALAVLQPVLALGLAPELAALRHQYDVVVHEVTELREYLLRLDSAQEELLEQDKVDESAEAPDTDDKPDDADEKDEKEDKKERDRKLWMKRHKGPRRPSLPVDPVPEPGEPPRPSTLAGKPGEPAVEQPAQPSTVWDGKP